MWTKLLSVAATSLMLLGGLPAALADEPAPASVAERQHGADRFVSGGSFSVKEPVGGDLIAVGGNIDVDAPVAGDVLIAGGNLRLGADIGQSVYAGGGQVKIVGKVGRNVRVAGGQVDIGPSATIEGNLSSGGGQVNLQGSVNGYVQVAGGRVLIDAAVGGDVDAASGHVELGPRARIAGKLRYRSAEDLKRDPAATVAGGIERLAMSAGEGHRGDRHAGYRGVGLFWMLGLMLLAAVLLASLPRFYDGVATTLQQRPGGSLLAGFVLLVCVPAAALILLITIIGVPLGLLLIALYLAVLPVAYVSAGIVLGGLALRRYRSAQAGLIGWRIGAALLGVLLLGLLGWIPWIGAAIGFAALLAGLGALLLQVQQARAAA